jgi:hypothetical protein
MNNRKKMAPATTFEAMVAHPQHLFITSLPSGDGWVEFAHALIKAKHRNNL